MAESVEHGYNNSVLLLGPPGCGKSMVSLSVQAASSFVARRDNNFLNQRGLWVFSINQFALCSGLMETVQFIGCVSFCSCRLGGRLHNILTGSSSQPSVGTLCFFGS